MSDPARKIEQRYLSEISVGRFCYLAFSGDNGKIKFTTHAFKYASRTNGTENPQDMVHLFEYKGRGGVAQTSRRGDPSTIKIGLESLDEVESRQSETQNPSGKPYDNGRRVMRRKTEREQ